MPDTTDHARHDPLLIAGLADRTADAAERTQAEALVSRCDRCADLLADLVAIRTATVSLPTPARPRDFRLTPDDAARLRRWSWRRIFGSIGSRGDAVSRPLAMGLTTLGLAGLLLTAAPSLLPGSASVTSEAPNAAAGAQDLSTQQAAAPEAQPASPAATADAVRNAASPPSSQVDAYGPGGSGEPEFGGAISGAGASPESMIDGGGAPAATPAPAVKSGDQAADGGTLAAIGQSSPGPSELAVLSTVLLLSGVALFVVRRLARRAAG